MTDLSSTIPLPGRLQAVRALRADEAALVAASPGAPTGDTPSAVAEAQRQAAGMIEEQKAALEQVRMALLKAVEDFRRQQREFFHKAETQVVDLSIEIARKVMMQEIQAGRYQIEPIVRESLSRVPSLQDVVVHLNAEDLARCPLAGGEGELAGVQFVADATVPRGECLVETGEVVVESSIEAHLDGVAEALKKPE